MSDAGSRRVEVEVPEETYQRLERVADNREQSIEDSAVEAIEEYAQLYDPEDPIYNVEPFSGGEPVDVENIDEYLYGTAVDE
jgi:hypothetical protein